MFCMAWSIVRVHRIIQICQYPDDSGSVPWDEWDNSFCYMLVQGEMLASVFSDKNYEQHHLVRPPVMQCISGTRGSK